MPFCAANVLLEAELTLEEDDDKGLKLRNTRTTDADGLAMLEFEMPKRFLNFLTRCIRLVAS